MDGWGCTVSAVTIARIACLHRRTNSRNEILVHIVALLNYLYWKLE